METKVTENVVLIDGWQKAWRLFSVWFFLGIGALPEIVNALTKAGLMEMETDTTMRVIQVMSILGIVARVIRQKQLEAEVQAEKANT